MKLLFFVGNLYPNLNATNKIAYQIAEYISKLGHQVFLFGSNFDYSYSKCINKNFHLLSITPHDAVASSRRKMNSFLQNYSIDRNSIIKKFIFKHPFSALMVNYSYSENYSGMYNLCKNYIEKIFSKNDFDYIVSFQEPYWAEKVMIECNIDDEKKILYQVDPYGLHELYNKKEIEQKINSESYNFSKISHIFTTKVLKNRYSEHPIYNKYIDKMTGLEFPNIRPITINNEKNYFSRDDINVVFCGLVDDSYRSPEKFFESITPLFDRIPNLKFHFWGDITSKSLFLLKDKFPNNIFINKRVDSQTSVEIQARADFLLNIGNSVSNQVPSKIFDYFSLGKPIINIQKIENCPAAKYFSQYPVCHTFYDYSPDIEKLEQFIINNKNHNVPFDIVEKTFYTATIEYVANKLTDILQQHKEI